MPPLLYIPTELSHLLSLIMPFHWLQWWLHYLERVICFFFPFIHLFFLPWSGTLLQQKLIHTAVHLTSVQNMLLSLVTPKNVRKSFLKTLIVEDTLFKFSINSDQTFPQYCVLVVFLPGLSLFKVGWNVLQTDNVENLLCSSHNLIHHWRHACTSHVLYSAEDEGGTGSTC